MYILRSFSMILLSGELQKGILNGCVFFRKLKGDYDDSPF